ncbi:hypothetical protein SAY86_009951 [Trapa natans]|uniref:Uncharacterized protein n=1 Tax=Trapa natans TaxID=22666 RepID=A0AAN7KXP4_TRANT|nr:hypothetical protein SAY86_009951 [Trapa natans]
MAHIQRIQNKVADPLLGSLPKRVAKIVTDQSLSSREYVQAQQHHDRVPEPANHPGSNTNHGRGSLDGEEHHNLRELPADAAPRHWLHHPGGLLDGVHRGLLRCGLGAAALPAGHIGPGRGPQVLDHPQEVHNWIQCLQQDNILDAIGLPEASHVPCSVWLLQAADVVHLQRGGGDGDGATSGPGSRLLQVEQRRGRAVLRVRLLQGRGAREHQGRLAKDLRAQHRRAPAAHRRLFRWMLRLPKHEAVGDRSPLRPEPDEQGRTQVGLRLVEKVAQLQRVAVLTLFGLCYSL